ncbi:MAG: hypothetical protein AAFZ05_13355, partial [Pseudomonadota bacterium]
MLRNVKLGVLALPGLLLPGASAPPSADVPVHALPQTSLLAVAAGGLAPSDREALRPHAPVVVLRLHLNSDGAARLTGQSAPNRFVFVHDRTGRLVGLTRTKPSGAWRVDGQVASFVGQHALTVSAGRSRALIRIAVPTGRRQSITVDLASLAQSRAGQRVRLAQANTSARDQETDADPAPEALPRGGLDEFLDPARRALGRAQRQYRDEVLPRLTTGGSAQGVPGDGNARARPVTDEDNPPPGSGVRERFDQAVDGIRSFLGGAIKGYQGQIVPRLSGGVPETAVTDRERDAEGRRSAEDETRPRDRDQGSTGERTVTRLPGTDDGEAARRAEQQRQARLRAEREAELARQRETEAREARIRERERE